MLTDSVQCLQESNTVGWRKLDSTFLSSVKPTVSSLLFKEKKEEAYIWLFKQCYSANVIASPAHLILKILVSGSAISIFNWDWITRFATDNNSQCLLLIKKCDLFARLTNFVTYNLYEGDRRVFSFSEQRLDCTYSNPRDPDEWWILI